MLINFDTFTLLAYFYLLLCITTSYIYILIRKLCNKHIDCAWTIKNMYIYKVQYDLERMLSVNSFF